MNSNDLDRHIRDLLFEVLTEGESKFLLVVSDDEAISRTVRETLRQEIGASNKKIGFIAADQIEGDLLRRFYEEAKAGTIDVLVLWGLDRIRTIAAESILAELNFHRDALASLKLPIVIWLNNSLLARLPSVAPDFWSRRTAIYRFTPEPTRTLLQRLFSAERKNSTAQPSVTGKATKEIVNAERLLGKCIKTRAFAVEEADSLIRTIQDNIGILQKECDLGRQIDVGLYLWNIAQVDKAVESFIKELGVSERNIFEYLYTDRNEALLHVAQKMQLLLKQYLDELPAWIQKRKRPSLIKVIHGAAIEKLNEIAADLESSIGISIDQLEPWLTDDDERSDDDEPQGPQDTVASAFGAQASYELESWLTGYNDSRPPIFTDSEGTILKGLYSQLSISEIAQQMGITATRVRKLVRELEEKVRLFLATSESNMQNLRK
jgi:hypothetical protein